MAKNSNVVATRANGNLPAYVEQGHVSIVFETDTSAVGSSTSSGSDPVGAISTSDVPEINAMVEPLAVASEVGDGQTTITTPPFREITTKESSRL